MMKLDFTKPEMEEIKSKIYLSELQERILEYRLRDVSITEMSFKEQCSESKINKEINKIKKKIMRVI